MDDDYDDDDENEFVSHKVEKIAEQAMAAVVGNENIVYAKEKVSDW